MEKSKQAKKNNEHASASAFRLHECIQKLTPVGKVLFETMWALYSHSMALYWKLEDNDRKLVDEYLKEEFQYNESANVAKVSE